MKQLVNQFDDDRTRATVATPTCSSCCCCCCCVATTLATSSVTAMNISELARKNNLSKEESRFLKVGAFLIFPLCLIGLSTFLILNPDISTNFNILYLSLFLIIWIFILKIIYQRAGLNEPSRVIGVTLITTVLFFMAEFYGTIVFLFVGVNNVQLLMILYCVLVFPAGYIFISILQKLTNTKIMPPSNDNNENV